MHQARPVPLVLCACVGAGTGFHSEACAGTVRHMNAEKRLICSVLTMLWVCGRHAMLPDLQIWEDCTLEENEADIEGRWGAWGKLCALCLLA